MKAPATRQHETIQTVNATNKLKKQLKSKTYLFKSRINNEQSVLEKSTQSNQSASQNPIITEFIKKIRKDRCEQRDTYRELNKLLILDNNQNRGMSAEKSTLMYEPNALNKSDIFSNESFKTRMSLYEKRLANLRQQKSILERLGNVLQQDGTDMSTSIENLNEYSYVSEFNVERTELVKMNDFNLNSLRRW